MNPSTEFHQPFRLPAADFSTPHSPVPWQAETLRTLHEVYLAEFSEQRAQSSRTFPVCVSVTVGSSFQVLHFAFIYSKRGGGRFNNARVGGFATLEQAIRATLEYAAEQGGHVRLSNPTMGSAFVRLAVAG